MKKIGAILSLLLITILMSAPICFAGSLEIVDSYPKEGQNNLQNVNCGVKLYFNEEVYSKNAKSANETCFELVDEKGKKVPTSVLYGSKEANMVMVLANKDLKVNAGYTLKVSGDLEAANGEVLGKNKEINFRTRDTSKDMTANMVMMVIMFGGMMFFSSKAMKKQVATQKAESNREDKVNPYKIAKETGKPVEEVIAKVEKEKEKKERAAARKAARGGSSSNDDEGDDEADSGNKRVAGPRPISSGGSSYITGRKAAAEKAAAEKAARGTTKPKAQSGKKKKKK